MKTYRDIVLADAPVLYWPLDDLRAYVSPDYSGNSLTGAINSADFGDPLIASSPCSRQLGGGAGYVIAPWASALNITGDITVEVWASVGAYAPLAPISALVSFGANGDTAPVNFTWELYMSAAGNLGAFHEYGSGVNVDSVSALLCPLDEVVLITLERNVASKTYTFYLNDDQSDTVSYLNNPTGGTSSACRARLGGSNITDQQNDLVWRAGHCAIYPRRLDADARARRVRAGRGLQIAGNVMKGIPPAPAKRNVVLISLPRALVLGGAVSDQDDGTYSAQTAALEGESVIGVVYPDYGEPWIAGHVYGLGDRTWVSEPAPLGHWYECEQAGTTGSTEPTWPTDGSTVTDGTVIWRDKGVMERPWAEGPYIAEAV